jgi:hypothetical protein
MHQKTIFVPKPHSKQRVMTALAQAIEQSGQKPDGARGNSAGKT